MGVPEFWEAERFGYHKHIDTIEDYDEGFRVGAELARSFLSSYSGELTIDMLEQVHGRLYGEIYHSSGEFRNGYDSDHLDPVAVQEAQEQIANDPDLTEGEKEHEARKKIAELHLDLIREKPFHHGNEEVADLITEWRMEKVFGEHPWQEMDRVDTENWDKAIERGDSDTLTGFLENHLQDARASERDPLAKFQQQEKKGDQETQPKKLSRAEKGKIKALDRESASRMKELEREAAERIERQRKAQEMIARLENRDQREQDHGIDY